MHRCGPWGRYALDRFSRTSYHRPTQRGATMTGRKLHDRTLMNDLDEVTARPKPISDEFVEETHEVGLSIDPEDMGEWALRSAAQEDVTQSGRLHEPLSINGESPSDAALSGPNFNSIDG